MMMLRRAALVFVSTWFVVACGPESGPASEGSGGSSDTGEPAPQRACEVVLDERVAGGQVSYDIDIAVADDGAVHTVWRADGVLHAARRTGANTWEPVDAPFAALDAYALESIHMASGGRAAPVLVLTANYYNDSSLWRWREGAWQLDWETVSSSSGNQGRAPLAVSSTGITHFSMTMDPHGDDWVGLLQLAANATEPVSEPLAGRDPLLAVDAAGVRHLVFAGAGDERTLHHIGEDGVTRELLPDHRGWPDLAVTDDGQVHVFAEAPAGPTLLSRAADGSWTHNIVGTPIRAVCEEMYDNEEGAHCEHRANKLDRTLLLGGTRVLMIAEQVEEAGRLTWACNESDIGCSWTRDEGFVETHTLVFGEATAAGVELSPLPITLPHDLHYTWGLRGELDTAGGVHLLLNFSDGEQAELRYMRLRCE